MSAPPRACSATSSSAGELARPGTNAFDVGRSSSGASARSGADTRDGAGAGYVRQTLTLVLVVGFGLASPTSRLAAQSSALTAADDALAHGRYEEAERAYRAALGGRDAGRAGVGLARLLFETGRYDESATVAEAAAGLASARVDAATVRAEALAARGRLDDAQAALESVAAEATAHRARVLLGRVHLRRGHDDEARPLLMAVVDAYNDRTIGDDDAAGLAYVAMATAMLEHPHDANETFTASARADPRRVETQLEWAELFLSHHDVGHAEDCVRDALAVNPRSARAQALSARIVLEQTLDFEGARRAIERALAVDPSLVLAHTTLAGMALRDVDIVTADRHLDDALAVDPTDLAALSLRAAVRFVEGDEDGFEAAVDAALALDPGDSEIFSIVAEAADWEHRYDEEVELAERALAIDPDDARAHATRGTNLLRLGEEEDGLAALERAFRHDRFDVRVFNTLNFYEDVIAPHYEWVTSRDLYLRVHHDERALLESIAMPLLREAYRAMRRSYRFTPRRPVRVEMFASTAHFSIRTSGLPNVGVQGVCFGRVVTALSPRAGPFDWAQIVWHELAHVFHLQLSHNRVPRWLTEGLAEHETTIARPEWAREEDHRLWLALESGRLPPLRDMNQAFTHARSAQGILDAYYAATRAAGFIVDTYGMRAVTRLLREYGRGRTTDEAFSRALRATPDEVDTAWRAAERVRLAARASDFAVDLLVYADLPTWEARASAAPTDAVARAEHAAALLCNGEAALARAEAREAVRLDAHQPIARFVLLSLAVERGDAPDAESHAADLSASGHDGYAVRLGAARAASMRGDLPTMRAALEAAVAIDPDRIEALQGLVILSTDTRDTVLARTALESLVRVDQHDRGSLGALLVLLRDASDWPAIVALRERVRFADPHSAAAHAIVARALTESGEPAEGLAEADLGLLAAPSAPASLHLERTRALVALRRDREAREAAEAAAAGDPSLGGAALALLAGTP